MSLPLRANGGGLASDPSIERIVVFRARMLAELLCAVPALRALRRGFPAAEIALIGLPWARAWVERLDCVDRFIEFPGHPGLDDMPGDVRTLPDFLARVQDQRFDLALQLHGSGEIVNPLVASLGARITAGFCSPPAWRPQADAANYIAWPTQGHEIDRLLALTDRLGLPRQGRHLSFPVVAADRQALARVWPEAGLRHYACVHAGALQPSRRWPVERFARVADRLAEQGLRVVLTGGPPERTLAEAVAERMQHVPVLLAGRTSLWTLGALIEGAELVVCNDGGVSQIAAALGTPSVVVSCGGDAERWAPLQRARHPVLSQPMSCRPCGHAVCPQGHGCAEAIDVAQVLHTAALLTRRAAGVPRAERA